MSHPMMAISIIIHISNLGPLGYSVLHAQVVGCLVSRLVLQARTCVFDDMRLRYAFQSSAEDIDWQQRVCIEQECLPAYIPNAAAVQ